MRNQTEVFMEMHPEQFSDSIIIKKGNLDRDFLDFYFESLTNKNLERQFENFCRRIAENEICPNLIPQTGPTGGGDSKVDSETYPVAEAISQLWYYGDGNKASTERWAFAFSAKKDWKPKVKSDVKKIAQVEKDENRGYVKIFFMSNQYIPDKKRADVEDELRNLYKIDVRILDRTWILEKIFSNPKNIEITIHSFSLSENFSDEIQVGQQDYGRKKELEQIENQLRLDENKPSEMISLSRKSIVLARELGFPKKQMLDLIERNTQISKVNGTKIDIANSIYDAAWTVFWWYSDNELYYKYYKEYESIALSENNVSLFINIITLFINLFSISQEKNQDISIHDHATLLKEKYETYISDPSKPHTALEAKTAYQILRYFLGDDINDIVNDILEILNDSFGNLDLDLYPLSRIIQEFSIFEKAERFNELFERLVTLNSDQAQKSEAALLLAKRGEMLKTDKPYEALSYFSRSLMGLYNINNKIKLTKVILQMGLIFENVGLLWAARNFYYYDFCLCLTQYMKFGEVSPILFLSADSLKYIDLRLGHLLYATSFDSLSRISKNLYPHKIKSENNENFDFILGMQIFRVPFDIQKSLEQLPDYLNKQGLPYSCAAIKYELGYYDESILSSLNNNTDAFDDFIRKWEEQPALEQLNHMPWFGIEPFCLMKTSVLGCAILLKTLSPYEHGEIEVSSTILATIESFFGTGLPHELISLTGRIEINIFFDENCATLIKEEVDSSKPNVINITFRDYDSSDIISEQERFSDFLMELLGDIIFIMFPYDSELKKIEKMVKNDAAFERSQTFSNSVFFGLEVLGKNTFTFTSIIHDFDNLKMLRDKKSDITAINNIEPKATSISPERVHYGAPPQDINFENVSNLDITTSSIINVPLWDICKWKGVLYAYSTIPLISLMFTQISCRGIFEDWIKEFGYKDEKNMIGIRIIKGIDKNNPFWYRVIIGQYGFPESDDNKPKIFAFPVRFCTMEPIDNINLRMFEDSLKNVNEFFLCPSYKADIFDYSTEPSVFEELKLLKNKECIKIINAFEIEENDFISASAILPTDEPIIPLGKEDSPILSIIERKKSLL